MPDAVHKVWRSAVNAPWPLTVKPRQLGISMVIDKGLGPMAFRDMLAIGADYIDLVKLGFGTSLLYPPQALAEKLAVARRFGVTLYPGGTLLEVAELQGTAEHFLDRASALGFPMVEISEGTLRLTAKRRLELILAAKRRGLRVISEVGQKAKGSTFDPDYVSRQVAADLAAGAEWVILEGRDSGKAVGIYDADGQIDEAMIDAILAVVPDPCKLVWEAPLVAQQQRLIIKLGHEVNLGNVQPEDVISLAATRAGLRGDTFRLLVESSRSAR